MKYLLLPLFCFAALAQTPPPTGEKAQAALASGYIQKVRETTDFAFLNRASAIVDRMLAADPKSYDGLRLKAEIETFRHDFPAAAQLARKLIESNPSDSGAYGMLGDSLMELGQYAAAGDAYETMLSLGANLTSYNRVAYHRFVTGKTDEALSWMMTAVRAGSRTPENLAWCLVEFGDMLTKTGHTEDARAAYAQALETMPGYHRALAAQARDFAANGEYAKAAANFERAQAVIPLPDYAAALEPLYAKLGRAADAAHQRELLDTIDRLGKANGEKGNRALAIAYADEGRQLDRAVELAQAELETRHDVYAYDALSWALFAAPAKGRRRGRREGARAGHARADVLLSRRAYRPRRRRLRARPRATAPRGIPEYALRLSASGRRAPAPAGNARFRDNELEADNRAAPCIYRMDTSARPPAQRFTALRRPSGTRRCSA